MYVINQKICTRCGGCAALCPALAIVMGDQASCIADRCLSCGVCAVFCPLSAIEYHENNQETVS